MKEIKIYLFCKDKLIEREIRDHKENFEVFLDKTDTSFNKDYIVPIIFEGGLYKLNSSDEYLISYEDEYIESKELTDGDIFICNFNKEKSKIIIFIQTEDISNSVFTKWYIKGTNQIKIGRSEDNHIVYENDNILDNHIILTSNEEGYSIKSVDNAVGCYVNQRKLINSQLKYGDVIFLYGLKCIYLEDYIAINNPNDNVYSSLINVKENQFESSLPREFITCKKNNLNKYKKGIKANQEKSISINPPNIDFKFNFKYLYYGVIPLIVIIYISEILSSLVFNNWNVNNFIYDGILNLFFVAVVCIISIILNKIKKIKSLKGYNDYLDIKLREIETIKEEEVKSLKEKYLTTLDSYNLVVEQNDHIWERNSYDEDFLNINMGEGEILFSNLLLESSSIVNLKEDNDLCNKYLKIIDKSKTINNAPITINLREINKLAIISDMDNLYKVVDSFLVQLTTMQGYRDLKVAFMLPKENLENIDYIKEIPHIYSNKKDFRYVATSKEELINLTYKLKNLISDREILLAENKEYEIKTNYVVFVYYHSNIVIDSFLNFVEKVSNKIGISVILITIDTKSIPDGFKHVLEVEESVQTLYEKNGPAIVSSHNYNEASCIMDMKKYVACLSKIKYPDNMNYKDINYNNSIFDLYNICNIDDLDIVQKWNKNKVFTLEHLPIAIKNNKEIFSININAKHHGPNGIIFGNNGTGKTEFLKSFILSYCINFNPYIMNFMVIKDSNNMKFNNLGNLPNVTDIIDKNIESEKNRLILLLKNEIKNRQNLFNSLNVTDIESYLNIYENYVNTKIIPYIVVVIDDVVKEDKNFLQQLIDLFPSMRSLGICTIISTSESDLFKGKKSILDRFDFKICFSISNSRDMVNIMDDINVSNPQTVGVFNIKLSRFEIYENLTVCFSNIEYDIRNFEESLDVVNNCGISIRKVSNVSYNENKNTQEELITFKILQISEINKFNISSIFNSSLKYLTLHDLVGYTNNFNGFMWCESKNILSSIVGIIDDPKYQVQRFLEVDFKKFGNLFIYGTSGMGKSTLIKTLVYSMCCEYKPSYLNMYIVDINSNVTDFYTYAPHVKEVVQNKDQINSLFKKVLDEYNLRKDIFESLDISCIENYELKTGEQLPYVILIVDSIKDIENDVWDYVNFLKLIAKEGSLYGIYVCVTSSEYGSMESKLSVYFNNKYILKLDDPQDYKKILGKNLNINPKYKGRGYLQYNDTNGSRVLEFQVGLPITSDNEVDLNNKIKLIFNQMVNIYQQVYESNIKEMFENNNINNFQEEYEIITKDIEKEMVQYDYLYNEERKELFDYINSFSEMPKNIIVSHNGMNNSLKIINNFIEFLKKKDYKNYLFGDLDEEISCIDFTEGIWEDFSKEAIEKFLNSIRESGDRFKGKKVCIFIPAFNEIIKYIDEDHMDIFNNMGEKVMFYISFNKEIIENRKILDNMFNDNLTIIMNHVTDLNEDTFIMYKTEKSMIKID